MKWRIPAKTFLLGEYSALAEGSAIILTTQPFFVLSITTNQSLDGIHPESPAGLWWNQCHHDQGLNWTDPYDACGGLGASSAQFLGSYLASCHLAKISPDLSSMLEAYYQVSWTGKGLRPSGYDVIAQSQRGCVFINKSKQKVKSYQWPFENLSFILLHTGFKLATHHHLQASALPLDVNGLSQIVDEAKGAFETADDAELIRTINDYHSKLAQLNLITAHSAALISSLKANKEVLAIKGCGALGADVILLICQRDDLIRFRAKLSKEGFTILATESKLSNFNDECLIHLE